MIATWQEPAAYEWREPVALKWTEPPALAWQDSDPAYSTSPSFSPADIAGLALWLDASVASSITSAGGTVSQWNDLSGNARHFTQPSGASQPSTGTTTQHGLNVISFNGSTTMTGSTFGPSTATFTLVVVARQTSGRRPVVALGSNNHVGISFFTDGGANSVGGLYGGVAWIETSTAASTAWGMCVLRRTGGTNTVRLDAADLTVTAGGSATPLSASGNTHLGGDGSLDVADIAEVLFYDGVAVSGTNLASLESYLRTKWGTP